jgi:recombinational DNA repair protein RecT
MNEVVKTQESQNFALQVEQKKNELTTILQKTILEQYAYDLNSQTPESFKKKQEVAKFISQLVNTKDRSGRYAILSCSQESILDCCITYCNNELNFFHNQAYLFPFGNKLSFMIGKDGYVAMAKQLNPGIEDFYYEVVYKGDIFEYCKVAGKTQIVKHIQKLENITCKIDDIVCAYATCVYKNGNHEADIMTIQEIVNALKTAQKGGFSDTHKLNPRIMLSKFPLRRLAKRKINQSSNEEMRKNLVFEDDNNITTQELPTMELTIDETQDFSEPTETIEVFVGGESVREIEVPSEEWSEEEKAEVMQEEVEQDENVKTIPYYQWINDYKGKGWEQVEGTYDRVAKTVQIRKVQ